MMSDSRATGTFSFLCLRTLLAVLILGRMLMLFWYEEQLWSSMLADETKGREGDEVVAL